MPTGALYGRVLAKCDWAQKHIDDFNVAVDRFRNANRDIVQPDVDPQTGDVSYRLALVPEVPVEVALTLGDALHNLRSALDYLAWGMVEAVGLRPTKYTAFPIFDASNGYTSGVAGKIQGLRQPCRQMLDRIQPYKGGQAHRLWQLHQLDIRDKHRLLLTTAFIPTSRTVTPSERKQFNALYPRLASDPTLKRLSVPHRWIPSIPSPTTPLQAGQILLTVPASDAQEHMGFSFDIAINEPEVDLKTYPAVLFLGFLSAEVQRAINTLVPCL
jgi:hypothetical protein